MVKLNENKKTTTEQQPTPFASFKCDECGMGGDAAVLRLFHETQYVKACARSGNNRYCIVWFYKNAGDSWSFEVGPSLNGAYDTEQEAWAHYDASSAQKTCTLTGAIFLIENGLWVRTSGELLVTHLPYLKYECMCSCLRSFNENRQAEQTKVRTRKCVIL